MQKHHQVFIFRKRLLAFSETFIADQSRFLSKYKANLLGYHQDKTGLNLLEGLPVYLLDEYTKYIQFSKLLSRLGLNLNQKWISDLKAVDAQLIHAHFLNDGVDALQLGERLNIPVVTTLHGHDITKKNNASSLKRNKIFFEKTNKVIAVSDYIAQHALKKGCPESKLIKHSIGINIDNFTGEKKESDQPSLLFVGRLVEKKGVKYLLDAIAIVQKKIPDISLTIVGDGKLRQSLESQAKALGINAKFVGKKTAKEIKNYLLSHWLFTAPSITADNGDAEGLGMVFLEAQSLKTPVISFSSGGVVEAIENEKTGLLCAEKDVPSLADNITQLVQDSSIREKMGVLGRERIEKYFNIKNQCQVLETIYDDLNHNG